MAETATQYTEFNKDLRNNDALAPVWHLMAAEDPESVKQQIYAEFISDIGERSGNETPERYFYKSWDFRLESNDLISDTGLSLRQLLDNGLKAAKNDENAHSHFLRRAEIQTLHPDILIDWRNSGDWRCLRLISLCPEGDELPAEIAKRGNFKPERMMASVWIFEPTDEGVKGHFFSLDNLTLDGLSQNDRQLGIDGGDYSSSLAKLAQPDYLNFTDGYQAMRAHKDIHDQRMESQTGQLHFFGIKNPRTYEESVELVASKPEVWELHWRSAQAVAGSLQVKKVTPKLAALVMEQRQGYHPEDVPSALQIYWQRPFSENQAREFMDYLRERSIPQYVFGAEETHQKSIATAGAYAVENNIVHSGDCPTSSHNLNPQASEAEMAAALQIFGRQEFISKWCPNCLKKPKAGKSVRAWRQGDRIGCHDCGREQDVCTGHIIKHGKRSTELKNTIDNFGDFIFASLAKYWSSIRQKVKANQEQRHLKQRTGSPPARG